MKKHLCRALLALTLALAVTETTLPTAWAAESEENAPLDCLRPADGSGKRTGTV